MSRAAHRGWIAPIALLGIASLACGGGGGGEVGCSGDWSWGFDIPPTPTPELIDAPDGGRVYVLLDGPAGASLAIVQVETGSVISIVPLASISAATSLVLLPESDSYLIGDAARGVAVTDAAGEETALFPMPRPVDIAHSHALGVTFVATTAGLFVFDAATGALDGGTPEHFTAIDLEERVTRELDEEGFVVGSETSLVVAAASVSSAGSLLYTTQQIDDDEWEWTSPAVLEDPSCVPRIDSLEISGVDAPRIFAGDATCDRVHAFSAVFGESEVALPPTAGAAASADRMAWSAERHVLAVADGDLLHLVDPTVPSATALAGLPRTTSLAGSIDARTLWVGSAPMDDTWAPALYRHDATGAHAALIGSAGQTIVDVEYLDRAPYFPLVFWGALAAPAKRGGLGYYEIEAVDPDGDAIEIAVEGELPEWIRFDEELDALTYRFPCTRDEAFSTTVTATAGRYRARIRFFLVDYADAAPDCDD